MIERPLAAKWYNYTLDCAQLNFLRGAQGLTGPAAGELPGALLAPFEFLGPCGRQPPH